ncbi:ABC transporter permease [Fulvivirgaceae bacterium BMA12]|uniref:ABC transporter permease n=1 Tax=Agaribacillus aureus TaxID=3051825 RepID=A0ABT8L6L0_9BACT|nr:ABC transporter permease [Fulvivirgaceae bacterium BMA12]
MANQPPKLFDKLLSWYCRQIEFEDIQGDLYEVYFQRLAASRWKANWLFALDVLTLFNPFSNRRNRSNWLHELYHFNYKNQLTIAIRNLKKHPVVNPIKIVGLSAAIVAFLYIHDYIRFQNSYDHFHEKKDRIFRVTTAISSAELEEEAAWANGFLKDLLLEVSHGVEHVIRLKRMEQAAQVKVLDQQFRENNLFFSDPELLEVMSYELIEGTVSTVLTQPNSVLLTNQTAIKYFGKTDVLGKSIDINNQTFQVTGVIRDIPKNSDLQFDLVIPFPSENIDWALTYLLLNNKASIENLRSGFPDLVAGYLEDYTNQGINLSYQFENIVDVHFSTPKSFDSPKGNKTQVILFQLIGYIILFISLVNYINLDTSQLVQKARGLGIRKIIGASKTHLFLQFSVHAFLSFGIAALLSFILISVTRAGMRHYTNFLFFDGPPSYKFQGYLLIVFIFLVLSSAFYAMTRFRQPQSMAVSIVRNHKFLLRKGLIGIQFALSFALILATIVIARQIELMHNQALGFNSHEVLCMELSGTSASKTNTDGLKQDLHRISAIQSVSFVGGNSIPGAHIDIDEYFIEQMESPKVVQNIVVDENFLSVLEISLTAGRFFSAALTNESQSSVVVNEAFVKELGWETAESALGKKISGYGLQGEIVGVIQDFYFHSPHQLIQPLILEYTGHGSFAMLKFDATSNLTDVMDQTASVWKNHFPDSPFEYSLLKLDYDQQFKQETAAMKVVGTISVLVIALALLGMYAIMLMIGHFRTKEMGIRKVNGADSLDIFKLFSKEFIGVLSIALATVTPFLWIGFERWLSNYPLRVMLQPGLFMLVATAICLAVFGIIYVQARRSNKANTVDTLKYE